LQCELFCVVGIIIFVTYLASMATWAYDLELGLLARLGVGDQQCGFLVLQASGHLDSYYRFAPSYQYDEQNDDVSDAVVALIKVAPRDECALGLNLA